jgi:hypothetical protein
MAVAIVLLAVPGIARAQESPGAATTAVTIEELAKRVDSLANEVKGLAAQKETDAAALSRLTERVESLSQELDGLRRERHSLPTSVRSLDDLRAELDELRGQLGEIRANQAEVEAPGLYPPGSAIAIAHRGITLATPDRHYTATLIGYLSPRLELLVPRAFNAVNEATFRIREARLGVAGRVASQELHYAFLFELTQTTAPLRDGYVELELDRALVVRAGQFLIPHVADSTNLAMLLFPERPLSIESIIYERDLGVAICGRAWGDQLVYFGSLTNGGGVDALNDNVDFVESLRLDIGLLGDVIDQPQGDYAGSSRPRLSAGASGVHDLVAIPAHIAGITVGNRDVDGNGQIDNIRVITAAADATFRWLGLELFAEGTFRLERWGTILQHSANQNLAKAIGANSVGDRSYLGFSAHAAYFVLPRTLLGAARVAYGGLPLLGVSGRTTFTSVPTDDKVLTTDLLVQLYGDQGVRELGLMYRYQVFPYAPASAANTTSHLFLLEALVRL